MPEHRAEVTHAWDEGPLMRGVRLSSAPEYRAGQALRVYAGEASNYFALATAHGNGRQPELLLRRGADVADAIIACSQPGAEIAFDGPLGPGFPLDVALGQDVLLVAVGSGLSAIRSIVETLLDNRDAYGRVALFYGQETPDHFAYAEARTKWQHAGVDVVLCAHGAVADWNGPRGYVQELISQDPRVDLTRAVTYLCGMPAMIAAVRRALAEQGVAPEHTYLNY
jgi:NAD(P)H-flavin reductase